LKDKMRILYTGPFDRGSVTRAKLEALTQLGYDIVPIDQNPYLQCVPKFLRKAQLHALIGPGIVQYNRALLDLVYRSKPNLVYVDQGSYLWPETMARLGGSGAHLVHYTSEHIGNRMYQYWYRHFWPGLRYYDAHIVTNKLSRNLLEERGAKNIVMSEFGYDAAVHRPPILSEAERRSFAADLLFIGHWEPTTARMIAALRRASHSVKVWGKGWWRAWNLSDRSSIMPIPHEDYAKAIAAAKIGLCFLSKWMRNESCGRTFEIPAIGTFLLAERTAEQLSYFADGKEAAFFSSAQELIDKAKHFLAHDEERRIIARAGHERCGKSGYTYKDRIKHDIEAVLERLARATAA